VTTLDVRCSRTAFPLRAQQRRGAPALSSARDQNARGTRTCQFAEICIQPYAIPTALPAPPSSETRHAATPKHSVSIKLVSNSRTEKKWLTRAPETERPSSTDTDGGFENCSCADLTAFSTGCRMLDQQVRTGERSHRAFRAEPGTSRRADRS
jgi:hypothetical protein